MLASSRREATKGTARRQFVEGGETAPLFLVQEGKTLSGFAKSMFAYPVTEKLPRLTGLLPARCQQNRQRAGRASGFTVTVFPAGSVYQDQHFHIGPPVPWLHHPCLY